MTSRGKFWGATGGKVAPRHPSSSAPAQVYINFLAYFHCSKIGRHTQLRFVGVRNRDLRIRL